MLFYSEDIDFECTFQRPFATSYWEYEYDLKTIYAKYNVQMKYKENLKTISPFIHLGFTANVLLYHSGVSQKTYYNTSDTEITEIRPSFIRAGIVGGVGAEYKQFSLDLRYEILGRAVFNSMAKNIYFILAYSFKSTKY
ncbi:MAG: hypothetical protein C0597_08755 [Marinilabiliales bacterium]|nr:MAG: hypothetical protein C0597_08755 [Marinilabiliales bacterium]